MISFHQSLLLHEWRSQIKYFLDFHFPLVLGQKWMASEYLLRLCLNLCICCVWICVFGYLHFCTLYLRKHVQTRIPQGVFKFVIVISNQIFKRERHCCTQRLQLSFFGPDIWVTSESESHLSESNLSKKYLKWCVFATYPISEQVHIWSINAWRRSKGAQSFQPLILQNKTLYFTIPFHEKTVQFCISPWKENCIWQFIIQIDTFG